MDCISRVFKCVSRSQFWLCSKVYGFDCIPWNVFRSVCSDVETIFSVVKCMESISKYWDLVSKSLNTDLMPFIFVKF